MLALFLRENGLTHCKDPVPIAAFHAGGVNSTTPWKKNLEVSPKVRRAAGAGAASGGCEGGRARSRRAWQHDKPNTLPFFVDCSQVPPA